MSGGPELGRAIGDAILVLACLAIVAAGAIIGGIVYVLLSLWTILFFLPFSPVWGFVGIPMGIFVAAVFYNLNKD